MIFGFACFLPCFVWPLVIFFTVRYWSIMKYYIIIVYHVEEWSIYKNKVTCNIHYSVYTIMENLLLSLIPAITTFVWQFWQKSYDFCIIFNFDLEHYYLQPCILKNCEVSGSFTIKEPYTWKKYWNLRKSSKISVIKI